MNMEFSPRTNRHGDEADNYSTTCPSERRIGQYHAWAGNRPDHRTVDMGFRAVDAQRKRFSAPGGIRSNFRSEKLGLAASRVGPRKTIRGACNNTAAEPVMF